MHGSSIFLDGAFFFLLTDPSRAGSPRLPYVQQLLEHGVFVDEPVDGRDEEAGVTAELLGPVQAGAAVVPGLVAEETDAGIS